MRKLIVSEFVSLDGVIQAPGGAALIQFLPYIAIMVVFYFLLFRPNQTRQKKLNEMLANLKNGDRVITVGGVHGTIVGLREDYIVLRVPPGVGLGVDIDPDKLARYRTDT